MFSKVAVFLYLAPAWFWNLLAIVFAVLAGLLGLHVLAERGETPLLRLAAGVLGGMAVAAGRQGKFLQVVSHAGRRFGNMLLEIMPICILLGIILGTIGLWITFFL